MNMKVRALPFSMMAAGLLAASPALADGGVSFSGFGTLGVTHSNSNETDFRSSIIQPMGVGMSKAVSAGIDTKAGLQAVAGIGKDLTATVQVVVDRRFDNTYSPRFEWANLKYQVNQDLHVRAGRVVAPVFMVSDYRNVGFAQTMVRMPYEVYGQNPITHMDGLDVAYKHALAGGTLGVQVVAGRIKEFTPAAEVNGNGQLLGLSYEKGASTFRIGYLKDKVDAEGNTLSAVDPLNQAGIQFGHLVGRPGPVMPHHDVKMKLLNLGYAYDDGTWLAQGEFVDSRGGGTMVEDTRSWYLMGGYRVGKWTPYVSYSRVNSTEPPHPAPAVAPFPALQPLADAINTVDQQLRTLWEQSTFTVGTRYDFYKNMALKLQLDHIRKPGSVGTPNQGMFIMPGSFSTSGTLAPAITKNVSVNLLTLTLDFVF